MIKLAYRAIMVVVIGSMLGWITFDTQASNNKIATRVSIASDKAKGKEVYAINSMKAYTNNIESVLNAPNLSSISKNDNEISVQDREADLDLLLYDDFNNTIYDDAKPYRENQRR